MHSAATTLIVRFAILFIVVLLVLQRLHDVSSRTTHPQNLYLWPSVKWYWFCNWNLCAPFPRTSQPGLGTYWNEQVKSSGEQRTRTSWIWRHGQNELNELIRCEWERDQERPRDNKGSSIGGGRTTTTSWLTSKSMRKIAFTLWIYYYCEVCICSIQ